MTLEAPIQIDLSQENSWDQIDDSLLTPEDKTFLREQFREDREGILYLTREEIAELRTTIEATRDPRGEAWSVHIAGESFQAFIEEQVSEEVSISELLWDTGNTEIIGNLETEIRDILFGASSPLANLELHEGAQDNFITVLSLSGIRSLAENPDGFRTFLETHYDTENRTFNFENTDTMMQLLGIENMDAFENFLSLAGRRESLWAGSIDAPVLHISDHGETNSIFMNIEEGRAFIGLLRAWSMSEEEIETYIEARNDQENILPNDISALREEILTAGESLGPIMEQFMREQQRANDTNGVPRNTPESPEEEKNWLEMLLEMITTLLSWVAQWFSEALEDITEILWGNEGEETQTEVPETFAPNLLQRLWELQPEILRPLSRENLVRSLENNPEKQREIYEILESFDENTSPEDELTQLLWDGEENIASIIWTLQWNNFPGLDPDRTPNAWDQFMRVLQEYQSYRQNQNPEITSWWEYIIWRRSNWEMQ